MYDFKPVAPGWTVTVDNVVYDLIGWSTGPAWTDSPMPVLRNPTGGLLRLDEDTVRLISTRDGDGAWYIHRADS